MKNDLINHPSHYTDGEIEVWNYIKDKKEKIKKILKKLLTNILRYDKLSL